MKDCLTQADQQSMDSIAIPIIGAGKIGLSAYDIGQKMIQVAVTFAEQTPRNLKEIHFIVYPTDRNSYAVLKQALTSSLSVEPQIQQKWLEILTKSADIDKSNSESDCDLLFKAQCNESKVPVDIRVYHGLLSAANADAIIDMTALCSKHTNADNHEDIANYTDVEHALQTLRCLHLSESNCSIYQVCPYGCLAAFSTLLVCISARGEKLVALPLLDIEMNAASIDSMVDKIESFMMNHHQDEISIHCFDLIIGYQGRSVEIATWLQDKIINKALRQKWKILQKVPIANYGMNMQYVASNKTAITNMKLNMMDYSNTWTRYDIVNEDYFNSIQPEHWYKFALKIWSEYNSIVVRKDTGTGVCIFGYETDIMNTVSYIYKLSKKHVEAKAHKQLQQFAAETAQWYASIGSRKFEFKANLNYEIEKNYNTYCKDKTQKNFYVDSDTLLVDYERMKISYLAKAMEASIAKSTFNGNVYR